MTGLKLLSVGMIVAAALASPVTARERHAVPRSVADNAYAAAPGARSVRPPAAAPTANVESAFSRFALLQAGHAGCSCPRTSTSNPAPQSWQEYS